MRNVLIDGGPVTMIWGFLIVYFFSLLCALSLAEISSKYPLELHAGAAIIAKDSYGLICSWFTGWFLLIGNWTMSISITFAGAQFILSVVGVYVDQYQATEYVTVIVFYIIVTVCGLFNIYGSKHLESLNKICVAWILFAIAIIGVMILARAPTYNSWSYVFTEFDNSRSNMPAALTFIIGLQQANFMMQGFGLLPAISEEVKDPERVVPRGIVWGVILSGLSGIAFIIPILLVLPDLSSLIDQNDTMMPIVSIFTIVTNSKIASAFLFLLVLGNLLFSGIGSIATSSRAVFSMSRDGALPYQDFWTYVDQNSVSKVPKNAVLLSMAISYILGLLSLVSTAAFNAFVGAAVISLCAASLIPITSSVLGFRKRVRGAVFKLRGIGIIINLLSIVWLVFTIFVLSCTPSLPLTLRSTNYALFVFIFATFIISILWFAWGRTNFHGPLIDSDANERVNVIEMRNMGTASTTGGDYQPVLTDDQLKSGSELSHKQANSSNMSASSSSHLDVNSGIDGISVGDSSVNIIKETKRDGLDE
ncbi:hypothetical protein WICPIJ_007984 [Wickerhamomyces pijperi]|uniref:Amino acid permease/ SLC12A domain-containing protein n=1 Tax=Wickerhamomyces pijperi TaxID=599730 RepID=A0A9P8Q0P4_WICPI|nr:hypothetical protein WICPIJ_007984 [Wickerhamomyces pijperi]